jgi:hypothetical protein
MHYAGGARRQFLGAGEGNQLEVFHTKILNAS